MADESAGRTAKPKQKAQMARGNPTMTKQQQARFIESLRDTANVTGSARLVGVHPGTVYDWRNRDPDFAAEWANALEEATDTLEYAARVRAVHGVREPLTCGKGLIMDPANPTQPLYVVKYSDAMTALLLKAHRREKFAPTPAEISPSIPAELTPDPEPEPDEPGPAKPIV